MEEDFNVLPTSLLLMLCLLLATAGEVNINPRQIVSLSGKHSRSCHKYTHTQAEEELNLFGFSMGSVCYTATSTMLNSIPFSCHTALRELLSASNAPPLNLSQLRLNHVNSELCQAYCSYPLRQAGVDCHELLLFHNTLSAACHTNRNGTM